MKLLFEIGCEEIPARFLPVARDSLERAFPRLLQDARLESGKLAMRTMATPRRLVLQAEGIPEGQDDLDEELLGPRVDIAYDPQGNPTKACAGFARGRGVDVADLVVIDSPKGEVVGIRRSIAGLPTGEVMPGLLERLVGGLGFPKSMRWGRGEHTFVRPVHWLVALLDDQVIPLEIAGVRSGNESRGHRFSAPEAFAIDDIDSYLDQLRQRDVLVDPDERRLLLLERARELAAEAGGTIRHDPGLEEEVTYLVEHPVPLLGRFDPEFLELPAEVLVAAMRNHQRYFSIVGPNGELLDAFVAVGNTPTADPDVVRHGNERVLAARLSDARFFFELDSRTPLSEMVPGLQEVIFQADLGTYYEKAHRMGTLAVAMAYRLDLGKWEQPHQLIDALTVRCGEMQDRLERFSWQAARTSLLAKTDLLTEMVGEFPELQGVMGGVYAARSGETREVVDAIREHYLPRHAGDDIPVTDLGAVVSLADRLDTLAGCFGVGMRPTGTADPFGLRRQCLGVIAVVLGRGYHLSLRWMLDCAVAQVRDKVHQALLEQARQKEKKRAARKKQTPAEIDDIPPFEDALVDDLTTFFTGRLKQRLAEQAPVDVVEAVLAAGMDDMTDAAMRVEALAAFAEGPAFADLAVAFKRVANIIKDFEGAELDPGLFHQEEERALHRVFEEIGPEFDRLTARRDFTAVLELLAGRLRAPVDAFFDAVLVNDPDDLPRQDNRKALLAKIETLFGRIADFTRLQQG